MIKKILIILTILLVYFNCNTAFANTTIYGDAELAKAIDIISLEEKFNKTFERYGNNKNLNRYTFMINPGKWKRMSKINKIRLYDDCTNYHLAKEYQLGHNVLKVVSERLIRIRSTLDGGLLAEYEPLGGTFLKRGPSEIRIRALNINLLEGYNTHKPKNSFEIIKNYHNLVRAYIDDNSYSYKQASIPRSYDVLIDKNGHIKNITLKYSDFIPGFDDYAVHFIKSLGPYPKFPENLEKDDITINITVLVSKQDVEEYKKQSERSKSGK